VLVDGRVVVQDGRMTTIDEQALLDDATRMYARVRERLDLDRLPKSTDRLWGASRA
jgi:hypothetical protein